MTKLLKLLAKIRWEWFVKLFKKPSYAILDNELEIKRYLVKGYYGIAIFDPYSLSSLFVVISTWILTGKIPKYTHILMNVEPENAEHNDFRFVEATSKGYHYSDFKTALGHAKRIALLTPKYYTQEQVDTTVSVAYEKIGADYDFKFNEQDFKDLTCCETYWYRLQKLPFSDDNFRCLKMLMEYEGNLTPQMFLCPDFRIVKEWSA
jgi:hypothetical protein